MLCTATRLCHWQNLPSPILDGQAIGAVKNFVSIENWLFLLGVRYVNSSQWYYSFLLSKIVPINNIKLDQIFYASSPDFFHQNKPFLGLLFCGLCPHSASGIRLGRPDDWIMAALAFSFYRYCVSCSPYSTISWFRTWSQFRYLWVHFFTRFSLARYNIFSSAASLRNTLFVFVTFFVTLVYESSSVRNS